MTDAHRTEGHAVRAVMSELRRDPRRPIAAIARDTGIAEAEVRRHVRDIVASGALTVTPTTHRDHTARHAFVGIRSNGDTTAIAHALARLTEVVSATLTTGAFDALVEVAVADDRALLELLNNRIRSLPGVLATDVLVCLRHLTAADG